MSPVDKQAKRAQTTHTHSFVLKPPWSSFFLVHEDARPISIATVTSYKTIFTLSHRHPSPNPRNPGWPLHNLLAYLRTLYPTQTPSTRVFCWSDPGLPTCEWKSRFGVVQMTGGGRPSTLNWEKVLHGLGSRVADLAPMMHPTRLATQAAA
ncbi:uncharacterized protein LACBIDRAFT_312169 [Laccaria bicolor S238N-H82]|uniref:Predicted protein n=1 Tax=Laccaria bicolor (strain S238N-H82 / ATCC MYA-4686) TaxID=486041 RepID=B0DVN3_LACBS|nr:uncharacterized protein LACBIDRAFT_312169 [Laccaria bicolor S238N-H82]EDR01331.1 predicted protein [Laccaria bicolor S238N-H82]|eukprot:XP_001888038.1 predicted protein [Laccaria bicolor S238N-H82]